MLQCEVNDKIGGYSVGITNDIANSYSNRQINRQAMIKVVWIFLCILFIMLLSSCNIKDEGLSSNSLEDNAVIVHDNIIIFPEPNGLVEVKIDTMGANLPTTKEEGNLPVMLNFTSGGASLNTYGEIKVQGSSTALWPKKNWTLKFYSDEERSERLMLKIGDSVASEKWIAKAEWVDPTMLRNALSYRLWGEMVQSRAGFPQNEVDNAWLGQNNINDGMQTGAQGYPKSHPAQIKVNGEHYGISILLLGHEPRNFNINTDNPKHIYMEFDARGGNISESTDSTTSDAEEIKTWEKFSADGIGKWISGYHPKEKNFTDEQIRAIDELGEFINGTQSDFNKNFDKFLDKTNMIDMLLFLEMIYDYDAVAQDIEIVSYDLEKWYMLPWDKDTTFGMDWDQNGIIEESASSLLINYESEDPTQKPWYKTYHAFTSEVEARYAQLREGDIFTAHRLYEIAGDITSKIPNEMWQAERERWEEDNRPSLDETSTSQIISWFEKRLETLDEHFNYTP